MTVATQVERTWSGQGAAPLCAFPDVVGAHWFQYCDEPLGGRDDGEDYDMGLIDTSNRPDREVTGIQEAQPDSGAAARKERQSRLAKRAECRCRWVPSANSRIDVPDQSLIEWDKEKTLLAGFTAPAPHVPFADVHMAWRPEGFYLFSLSDIYVDPNFLDYRDNFPIRGVSASFYTRSKRVRNHLAIYLIPHNDPSRPDGFEKSSRSSFGWKTACACRS